MGKWYSRESWRLIEEIYRNVENKVVFGDFESD
jgi:hypothetical protein